MDFAMGLILSFTDNASAGMNNAVNSLDNLTRVAESASESMEGLNNTVSLMATAQSANMIGNGMIGAGKGMLNLFESLLDKTKQLGSEYENFGITLSALGMDSESAIRKLFDFANHSPLEVGDVKDMITTLQAQGINAFQETTGAISGTRQEFLAYLTDLKSFKPDVIPMRFNMAIQNYIGSGEKKMMRTTFDMGDIEDIIGHKMGKTAEDRMQDIVELVEKKGLTGLSAKLSTTWQGVASNIDDAFTRIYYSIANDGGLFEKLKNSFMELATVIIDLPDDDLKFFGKTIGDALNTIVTPITKVIGGLTKLIKSAISLSKTHPKLIKMGIILTTVAGAGLVLGGVIMKLIGSFANFAIVMKTMGVSMKSIGGLFKNTLGGMAVSLSLLLIAWNTDFAGIRTMTMKFLSNLSDSFKTARESVDGSVLGLRKTLNELRQEDDFWSSITLGFMKIYGAVKFVSEAWSDNTLSFDSFEKAKDLGILPLIEAVLDLKYRFEFFKKGFIEGWKEIGTKVENFIDKLTSRVEGTPIETLTDKLTSFLQIFSTKDTKNFETFGRVLSKITATFLAMKIVPKVLGGVTSKLSLFSAIGKGASSIFSKVFGGLFGGLFGGKGSGGSDSKGGSKSPPVGGGLGGLNPKTTLKTMESIAIIIGGISLIAVALGVLSKVPYFNTFLVSGVSTLMKLAVAVVPLGIVAVAMSAVVKAMSKLGTNVKSVVTSLESTAIMLGGLSVIMYALGALSNVPYFGKFISSGTTILTSLAKVMFPIAVVAVATAGIIKAFNVFGSNVKKTVKGIANLAVILGGMSLLIATVGALTTIQYFNKFLGKGSDIIFSISKPLGALASARVMVGLLGIALYGAFRVDAVARGITNLAIVLGGMQILITAMGALSSVPFFGTFLSNGYSVFNNIVNSIQGLANAKAIIAIGAIALFGALPIPMVASGLANLAIVLGGFTLLIEAFGLLSKVPYFTEFLQTGGDTIALLFEQIGKIAGSVIGGFAEGVTNSLPEVGSNLAQFGENIKPLFSSVKDAPLAEFGEFGKGLGVLIGALTAEGITKFITGGIDLPSLGTQLSDFGKNAKDFFNNVAEYPEEGVKNAPKVMGALSKIGDYNFRSGGWLQKITGEVDLKGIGTQLSKFSTKAKTFFNTIKDYPEDGLKKAPEVFKALAGAGDYDFKSGGLLQAITGSTDLAGIGQQLSDFSGTAEKFFNWAAGKKFTDVWKARQIIDSLSVLSNFKSGGLASLFSGSVDIVDVGEQLSDFSEESNAFYVWVEGLSVGAIRKSNTLFECLLGMNNFKSGGIIDAFVGGLDLPALGSQLSQFATNVKPFYDTLDDIEVTSIDKAEKIFSSLTGVKSMIDMATLSNGSLSNFGQELVDFITSVNSFAGKAKGNYNFSSVFNSLKSGMKSFVNVIVNNEEKVSDGTSSIKKSISSMSTSGTSKLNTLTSGMTKFVTSVSEGVKSTVQNLKTLQESFNNLKIKFPEFKVPEITTSGKFDLKAQPPVTPKFKLTWHKDGGIFSSPSVIGVGEAGKEAVVPLEKNLGWLDNLANMLTSRINRSENIAPSETVSPKSAVITRTVDNSSTTSTSTVTKHGKVDNSVHFEAGSIVIQAKDFSAQEAERFAKMIMNKIKRQKEIKGMLNYES